MNYDIASMTMPRIPQEETAFSRSWRNLEERAPFQDEYIQPGHNNKSIHVARKLTVPFAVLWSSVRIYIRLCEG